MDTDAILYLNGKDVQTVGLSMSEIVDALDGMFKEKRKGYVEIPPKPGIHRMFGSTTEHYMGLLERR